MQSNKTTPDHAPSPSTLIAAVEQLRSIVSGYANPFAVQDLRKAETDLLDYVLAHCAALAERERLEAAVVEAQVALDNQSYADDEAQWNRLFDRRNEMTTVLARFLVRASETEGR